MGTKTCGWVALAGAVLLGGAVQAQDAPPAEVLSPAADPAPPAAEWRRVAASQTTLYAVDFAAITNEDGVARLTLASIIKGAPAGDQSHTLRPYEFRCRQREYRNASGIEFGPTGAEVDRWETADEPWERFSSGSLSESLFEFACQDMETGTPAFPTLQALVASGAN